MDDLKHWTFVSMRLIDEAGLSAKEVLDMMCSLNEFKQTSFSDVELRTGVLLQLNIRNVRKFNKGVFY